MKLSTYINSIKNDFKNKILDKIHFRYIFTKFKKIFKNYKKFYKIRTLFVVFLGSTIKIIRYNA